MSLLIIVDPSGERSAIGLDCTQRYRIGRAGENEVVLRHPQVSRFHAELFFDGEHWRIRDCGSSNGTRVDGVRIADGANLPADGHLGIGEFTLRIEAPEDLDDQAPDEMATYDETETVDQGAGDPAIVIPAEQLLRVDANAEPATLVELQTIRTRLGRGEPFDPERTPEPTDDLLVGVLGLVIEMIGPDRAAVVSQREDGSFAFRAFQSTDGSTEMKISKTIARTAIKQRAAILTDNARHDPRFADAASDIGARSLMVVPLSSGRSRTSLIYVDARIEKRRFRQNDLELLTRLANIDSVQIENTGARD